MTSRIPPLSALKAFEAMARLERVNAVAKELHLTHSAVSHQLKGLEELVGVALFDRSARHMTLTEAGRTYAYQVRQSLDELSQATQKLSNPAHEDILSIAVLPSFATHWLIPRLADFQQTYPNVVLSLHAGLSFIEFEKNRMKTAQVYVPPKSKEDMILEAKVNYWKNNKDDYMTISPFNSDKWSYGSA
jgi:LysR family glycine cleavage system transcriptional activator